MEDHIYKYWGSENSDPYEWLNRCSDPHMLLEQAWEERAPIIGKIVLDIGAGAGFHAVRYAAKAEHVYALEPHASMRRQLFGRLSQDSTDNISVLAAGAETIPLPDCSIDVAYARFAYFFGTAACLPGLAQVRRILRPGGHFFAVDADPDRGEFGRLARLVYPQVFTPDYSQRTAAFYASQGFESFEVDTVFRAPNREILELVFHKDFAPRWEEAMQQVNGCELTYGLLIHHLIVG